MDKSIDPFLNTDKDTEIGDIFDFALDNGAHRVIFAYQVPGIRLQLLHAERDTLGLCLNIEHHNLDFIINSYQF